MSSLFSDDAPRLILGYVEHYNNIRLKSAVGYVSLMDMLAAPSRRSTGSGTESWSLSGNSGRYVGRKPHE
jgi:hypothetical protein